MELKIRTLRVLGVPPPGTSTNRGKANGFTRLDDCIGFEGRAGSAIYTTSHHEPTSSKLCNVD